MTTFRTVAPEDSALLAQLHARNFGRAWSQSEFASFFERDGIIGYLAQIDGSPVGFIFCWAVAGECELLALAVEENFRRRGLARHLCEQAIADSLQQHANVMHLEVALSNQGARALYQSLGFEICRRRKDYYRYPDGTTEDALTMRCDLL